MTYLHPGEPGFEDEAAGFQTAFRHEAKVIAAVENAEDVRAAVRHARERGLPVAVQATGHGLTTPATGLLISTRRMRGVRVDPVTRTAWVEAGARWKDVLAETREHGLAPLSGSGPGVGAVSYSLGGGVGLLARRFGFAADHVRRVELVTEDGDLVEVTAESDPDLFWAIRGGRSGFGVVTGLELALFPVATLFGGGLYFGPESLADVLRGFREWTATVPEELTSSIGMVPMPDVPGVPEPLRGKHVAHVRVAHSGDPAEGERLVAPLRELGPPLMERFGEIPFADAARTIFSEPDTPHGYYGDTALLTDFPADTTERFLELAGPDAPIGLVTEIRHLGGALSRPPEVPNAVSHREARYQLMVLSGPGAAEHAAQEEVFAEVEPWTLGRALNFAYGDRPAVRAFHSPEVERRLAELRTR
ncbi:FAD-binding oxidoreductase [Amycolatopsis sp. 195334CR]|uniref:FAD-binding oxidoreductase n=1 Tax=Amycolatopsis sp. 195334CR TaxID=2814588 RepID=UPI001A8F1FA6|nr:FAD-binding oxidoreductase [Amycolatopsis sp. 195334CR]MBN6033803.1 FAD-binding oxidoreductase [Amycolatopsis sp. 195334CR]